MYEEEVFGADYALWWSPDSSKIAYLALDETLVDEFIFPIYNPTNDANAVIPYTEQVTMKYPKPGYNNPLVSVHVFDVARYLQERAIVEDVLADEFTLELDWSGRHPKNNSIITEVTWVGNNSLLVKESNRNADEGNVVWFNLDDTRMAGKDLGRVVRKLGKGGEHGDNGWIEAEQRIYPLPSSLTGSVSAYLDIVPTKEGFNHIALFTPADSSTPIFLTSGNWEVTEGIQAVDTEHRLVYAFFFAILKRDLAERRIDTSRQPIHPLSATYIPCTFRPWRTSLLRRCRKSQPYYPRVHLPDIMVLASRRWPVFIF